MRVGIDLGTTNTLVSYVDENGTWKLLKFEHSGRRENPYFLPSCLAIKNGSIIVGQPAIDYCLEHPDLFLSNTKYDMGKTGTVYHLENYAITPQEAAQHILNEVYKELTFQFPRETTFNAFVTVPARFGNEARQTTKAALISSNFETDESCLTDEPIAAAVAYSSMLTEDNLVLVVDIGGGTFDLSLLKTSMIGSVVTNRLEPVAWNGELRLGGNDVDEILIKKMAQNSTFVHKNHGAIGKNHYLCIVFFMVLDLRLSRLGLSGVLFLCPCPTPLFHFLLLSSQKSSI